MVGFSRAGRAAAAVAFLVLFPGRPAAAAEAAAAGSWRPAAEACAAADGAACAGPLGPAEDAALGLLQRHSRQQLAERRRAAGAARGPAGDAWPYSGKSLPAEVFPLAWLHVPKCGSSFINALTRAPGACHDIPTDVEVTTANFGPDNLAGFWSAYPWQEYCPGAFSTGGGHVGLGKGHKRYKSKWKGHGVTILRQPEQRVLSAFHDNKHSWPYHELGEPPKNPLKFARVMQGCTVRMLTRNGTSYAMEGKPRAIGPHWGGPCGGPELPTPHEVKLAKRRLREAFIFVGIQEEWPLSMCLFHATFGGPCHEAEFLNSRHADSADQSAPEYDVSVLKGFRDPYDAEIYEEAKQIFNERLRAHNLSAAACQPCFRQANVTYAS